MTTRSRKRQQQQKQKVLAEDIIAWIWEDDDPGAATCDSRHLDVNDRSIELSELMVYDNLLGCSEEASGAIHPEHAVVCLDRTLANILAFADDCQAAVQWLTAETVTHSDEQSRRAGQRRRHLKERGLLKNGLPFVRLCGQVIIDSDTIAISAARQCIDNWEETTEGQALHFRKEEDGMRWQPESTLSGRTVDMDLSNPYTAPSPAPEADGRTVHRYNVELGDDEEATAERREWTSANPEPDVAADAGWVLNKRGESAVEWLSVAAETVTKIATLSDEDTLRQLFPSIREIRRRQKQEAASRRAAEQRTTEALAAEPGTKSRGPTVH